MNIKINEQGSDAYIYNLAFIKAILIKNSIDSMALLSKEKEFLLKEVLKYLKDN